MEFFVVICFGDRLNSGSAGVNYRRLGAPAVSHHSVGMADEDKGPNSQFARVNGVRAALHTG